MFNGSQGAGFQANQNNDATNAAMNNLNSSNAILQQQASGGGAVNQATQAALTGATNQGIKEAAGTVASTKGINPALAGRLAGQQAAQSGQQAANAAAGLTAQNSMAATNALNQGALQQYGISQGGLNAQNAANAGIASQNVGAQAGLVGGLLSAAGSAVSPIPKFAGGEVKAYASGGEVDSGPKSYVGKFFSNMGSNMTPSQVNPISAGVNSLGQGIGRLIQSFGNPSTAAQGIEATGANGQIGLGGANLVSSLGQNSLGIIPKSTPIAMPTLGSSMKAKAPSLLARGGKVGQPVKAMVSPGEIYLSPDKAQAAKAGKIDPIDSGEKIPGKAKVKGNSIKNDIVPKTLESGGLVIPKSVMESKNPHEEAYQFINAHLAKSKLGR